MKEKKRGIRLLGESWVNLLVVCRQTLNAISKVVLLVPSELVYIKDWAFCANADVSFYSLFNAAKTSPHTTRHQVFKRYKTRRIILACHLGNSLHHWFGTTGSNTVKLFVFPNGMVRHEAFLTQRSIFCGGEHSSKISKSFKFENVSLRTTTKQKHWFVTCFKKLSTIKEHWGCAHATPNKKKFLFSFGNGRNAKTIAQGVDAIEVLPLGEFA